MRSRHAGLLVAALAATIGHGGLEARQLKTAAEIVQTSADLAVALAQSGYSAGLVLELPPHLNSVLQREQSRTKSFLTNRSAFGVWMRNDASPGNERALFTTPAAVDAAAARMASTAGMVATRWRNTSVYLLKAPTAGVCLAGLKSKLPEAVASRNIVELVTSAVRSATGAKVPGGYVGSCVGTNDFAPEAVTLQAGETLEDALSSAVAQFGSSAWAAVQDMHGQCSIGVIRRAEKGGICMTAVTSSLKPER